MCRLARHRCALEQIVYRSEAGNTSGWHRGTPTGRFVPGPQICGRLCNDPPVIVWETDLHRACFCDHGVYFELFRPVCRRSPVGEMGSGTAFSIGFSDIRYANIAPRSSSVIRARFGHGIGGRMGRPSPISFPVRNALMNISSVQLPRPVATSGVRFRAKLTPHGPAHAVKWFEVKAPHLPGPSVPPGTSGTLSPPDGRKDALPYRAQVLPA